MSISKYFFDQSTQKLYSILKRPAEETNEETLNFVQTKKLRKNPNIVFDNVTWVDVKFPSDSLPSPELVHNIKNDFDKLHDFESFCMNAEELKKLKTHRWFYFEFYWELFNVQLDFVRYLFLKLGQNVKITVKSGGVKNIFCSDKDFKQMKGTKFVKVLEADSAQEILDQNNEYNKEFIDEIEGWFNYYKPLTIIKNICVLIETINSCFKGLTLMSGTLKFNIHPIYNSAFGKNINHPNTIETSIVSKIKLEIVECFKTLILNIMSLHYPIISMNVSDNLEWVIGLLQKHFKMINTTHIFDFIGKTTFYSSNSEAVYKLVKSFDENIIDVFDFANFCKVDKWEFFGMYFCELLVKKSFVERTNLTMEELCNDFECYYDSATLRELIRESCDYF